MIISKNHLQSICNYTEIQAESKSQINISYMQMIESGSSEYKREIIKKNREQIRFAKKQTSARKWRQKAARAKPRIVICVYPSFEKREKVLQEYVYRSYTNQILPRF